MSFEDELFSHLSSYPGMSTLVGTKIQPDVVDQDDEPPYIRYLEVYREKNYTHQGYSGFSFYTMQLSIYAETKSIVRQIADLVARAMEKWPAANSQIGRVFQENENSGWEHDQGLYYIDMDFDIFYRE